MSQLDRPLTAGKLAYVIVEADVDPSDDDAITRALVERGVRPAQISRSILPIAEQIVNTVREACRADP